MKITSEYQISGIFTINGDDYSGYIQKTLAKSYIEIKIISSKLISWLSFLESKYIDNIHGILQSKEKYVTLLNNVIYQSQMYSHGISEYIIKSRLGIFGEYSENIYNQYSIPNINFYNPNLSIIIGNRNTTSTYNTSIGNGQIEYKNIIEKEYSSNSHLGIKIISKVNYNLSSVDNFSSLHYYNIINLKQVDGFSLLDIRDYYQSLSLFVSFISKTRSITDEVFYTEKITVNQKEKELSKNIFYGINEPKLNEYKETDTNISRFDLYEHFGKYFIKWNELFKSISFLRFFFEAYYLNKYIDQKILFQIFFIESLFKYIFGTKNKDPEYYQFCERITSLVMEKNDRERLLGILHSKTGMNLKQKIKYLCEYINHPLTESKIDNINKYRNTLSHGASAEIDDYNLDEMSTDLFKIIDLLIIKCISEP